MAAGLDVAGRTGDVWLTQPRTAPVGTRTKSLAYQTLSWSRKETAETTGYCRRNLVPLTFWLLSVLRKLGISRSISSKYEERAGVCWFGL